MNTSLFYNQTRQSTKKISLFFKRYRFKTNYARTNPQQTVIEKALRHFDVYYSKDFNELWPTLRVGLLSQPKQCALVNNFGNPSATIDKLWELGSVDFTQLAREEKNSYYGKIGSPTLSLNEDKQVQDTFEPIAEEDEVKRFGQDDSLNLQQFMPTTRVLSERESLEEEEMAKNTFQGDQSEVQIIFSNEELPKFINAFSFEKGVPTMFEPPTKSSNGYLDYILIDGGALLPVFALDLQPEEVVGDFCCGSGGKSMIMLQSLMPEQIHSVDRSYLNMRNLRSSFQFFLSNYKDKISTHHVDLFRFYDRYRNNIHFDKILLDVPCNSDRLSVTSPNMNMFTGVKQSERLELTEIQSEMLCLSLKMLKVGGSLVYTTTTLSQAQNDGVIQATLQQFLETDLEFMIHDLSRLVTKFGKYFWFHKTSAFACAASPFVIVMYDFFEIYCYTKRLRKTLKQIPGNRGHWLFGQLREWPDELDERVLKRYREKVHKYPKWRQEWMSVFCPELILSHPETAKVLFNTANPKSMLCNGVYRMGEPWLGNGLLNSGGDIWKRNRKLLTPAFHYDILKSYLKVKNEAVDKLLVSHTSKMSKNSHESFEIFSALSMLSLDIMLRTTMSYETPVQELGEKHPYLEAVIKLQDLWMNRALNPFLYSDFIFNLSPSGFKFRSLCNYVHGITDDIVRVRRQALKTNTPSTRKYKDLLDILLLARDDSGTGLTDKEIRAEVDTFLFAGHDTTSSALSWTLYQLAQYPEIQEKCRAEIDKIFTDKDDDDIVWSDLTKMEYLTRCIKESLRRVPPVPVIQRRIDGSLDITGVEVPHNSPVSIHIYEIHNNTTVWENPLEFDPDRFLLENTKKKDPFSFVAFSAGPRNCIGQNFAMNELKIVISKVLRKFRLETDPEKPSVYKFSIVSKAMNGLYVKLNPRSDLE
ncbi:DgyrCDS5545 [Dimorphilus gyrociliatus]|uniref:DgyrCDS5545 n=1 Tax=Dimorphilus gyrociliatus TaxID=2664684 RepID=A0A7I8VKB7_9ANNE|nr:DgyrCDS5545 [Dimorphilus gyrociliatus]